MASRTSLPFIGRSQVVEHPGSDSAVQDPYARFVCEIAFFARPTGGGSMGTVHRRSPDITTAARPAPSTSPETPSKATLQK
jgi:hypothetical protein